MLRVLIPMMILALLLGVGLGTVSIDDVGWGRLWDVRGWRCLAALLAGTGLAVAGMVVQALFRNPLAEPGVLGIGAGANLGGLLVIVLSTQVPALPISALLPVAGVAGALTALLVLQLVARRLTDSQGVLLIGVVLSLLLSALAALLTSAVMDDWALSRAMLAFGMGGVGGVSPSDVGLGATLTMVGLVGVWRWRGACDVLLSGTDEARALGLDVDKAQRWLLLYVAFLVAGAAAMGGAVAFVGLVVPFLLRLRIGPATTRMLPRVAVAGGLFLLTCDLVVRWTGTHGQIPLGVMTGLIGAPIAAWMIVSQRGARSC